MVQYILPIAINHPKADEGKVYLPQLYWPLMPGCYVPPEWKGIPNGVLEEWTRKLPRRGRSVILGGTRYTLVEDILLPQGQDFNTVTTTHDLEGLEAEIWV